jgi:hypothetical protein
MTTTKQLWLIAVIVFCGTSRIQQCSWYFPCLSIVSTPSFATGANSKPFPSSSVTLPKLELELPLAVVTKLTKISPSSWHYRNRVLYRVSKTVGKGYFTLGKGFAECNTRQRTLDKDFMPSVKKHSAN